MDHEKAAPCNNSPTMYLNGECVLCKTDVHQCSVRINYMESNDHLKRPPIVISDLLCTLLHPLFEHDSVVNTAGWDTKVQLPVTKDSSTSDSSNLSCPNSGGQWSTLMMTCQIAVVTLDSRVAKALAFLNLTSSTLFTRECLAQWLQLSHQCQHVQVTGIGGSQHKLPSRSVVTLIIANKKSLDVGWVLGLNGS